MSTLLAGPSQSYVVFYVTQGVRQVQIARGVDFIASRRPLQLNGHNYRPRLRAVPGRWLRTRMPQADNM